MACHNLVMVGYFLSVKGFFFLCVQQVSVSRLDWCRASSWVQAPHSAALVCKAGVAAVRGRVGTGRRLDTQTECFAPGRIQLHAPCYTHTIQHNHFLSFFSFPFLHTPSVCSACLPFHLTSCCLHLSVKMSQHPSLCSHTF